MKIGLDGATPDPILTQRNPTATEDSSSLVSNTGEDKATLTLDRDSVSTLTSQAMEAPETRQDKIEALRQSISTGQYSVDPAQVADAILQENSNK